MRNPNRRLDTALPAFLGSLAFFALHVLAWWLVAIVFFSLPGCSDSCPQECATFCGGAEHVSRAMGNQGLGCVCKCEEE